ncbi:hypothetical protein DM02DRAFT_660828 [Periconia macrospinosa]|uniref:Uncharacterized protein n=1 Tax=Periconia macrospinosa TaxID=97972 RepID=A0A2V1D9C5_9PLEO|nr:hypothetical protein DM02DRAFT_660828 [Periconia macrospinosa]
MAETNSQKESSTAEAEGGVQGLSFSTDDQHEHDSVAKEVYKEKKLAFLSLPGEIRNQIYGYVFGEGDWHVEDGLIFKAYKRDHKSFGRSKNPLALLQTCKTVHAEAYKLPFTLCAFVITPGLLYLRCGYPKGQCYADTITIYETHQDILHSPTDTCFGYDYDPKGLFNQFPSLKNIRIEDWTSNMYDSERDWYRENASSFMEDVITYHSDKNLSLEIQTGLWKEMSIDNNTTEILRRLGIPCSKLSPGLRLQCYGCTKERCTSDHWVDWN